MKDKDKTHGQLLKELTSLHERIAQLEGCERQRKAVEETLTRSDQEKTVVLSSISELVAYQDTRMRILWVNRAAAESVGVKPQQLVGRHCYEIWPQRDSPCVGCPVVKARKSGRPEEAEMTTPDGRIWLIRGYPVRDKKGTVTGAVEVTLEITDRKRAEESLRTERDKAQQYLDIAEVILVALNKKGEITLINRKGNHILGYKEGELLGKSWFTTCVPARLRKKIKNGFLKLMAGEVTLTEFYENPVLTKSGTEKIMAWHNSLVKDAQGNPIGTLSSGEDITDRKQAEEALKESEKKYRQVVENATDIIYTTDINGNFTYANSIALKVTGYSLEELQRFNYLDLVIPEYRDQLKEIYGNQFRDRQETTYVEFPFSNKFGEVMWFGQNASLMFESRKIIGFQVIARDLTERKQAEEKLRENEERYKTLFEEAVVGICLADAETGIIIDCNQEMATLVDRERADLIDKSQKILHPPQNNEEVLSPTFKQHLTNKKGQILETQVITRTGDIREVEIKANFLDLKGRKVLQGLFHDITDRKQAEATLLESETRFRTLFEAIPDTVLVHDDKGTILHINEIGAQQLEWSAKNLIGRNLREIVTPENAASIVDHVRETHKVGWNKFETTYVSRSGWRTMAEVYEHPIVFGTKKAILSVARDITERKQAEEALQASEKRFRQFFESEPTYCYMISPEGIIIDVNNTALNILGYTKKELVGKPVKVIYAPESLPKMEQLFSQWKKIGELRNEEMVIITKKGEKRMVLLSADAIKGADGNVLYSLSVQNDITELKQADEALREKEETIRAFVETSQDWIWSIDLNGIHTYSNPAVEKILGYTPADLIGKLSLELIHDEDRRAVEANLPQWIKKKSGWQNLILRWRHKDGSWRWLESNAVPIFDTTGKLIGFRGVDRDITARKKTEEALLNEKIFSDTIMDSSPGLFFVFDDQGNILRWNRNAEKFTEYSTQEISKMNVLDFVVQEDKKSATEAIQEVFNKGQASAEITILSKSGKKIPFYFTGLRTHIENITCVVCSGFDITERKQIEEALRESEEKFRNLAEHSPNMIFINVKSKVVYANEKCAEFTGYSREEFYAPDFDFMTLIAPEYRDKVQEVYGKHMRGEEVAPYEYTLISKEGRKIAAINATKLIQYGGEQALLGVVTDITEIKQAKEKLQRSYDQLQKTFISSINALASTVEMKDQYTAGHQPRVTQLACAIAEEMGLSKDQIEGIRMAGLIHDIGKIVVPAEILNKPGPLTEVQYEMIKMHPQAGHDILKRIAFPWPVAQIVHQHHEMMDGSGYPQGLAGEDILPEARVMAVANIVEAMTAHRPYRPAYDIEEALAEILHNRGTKYDSAVVDACLRLFTEKGFVFDSAQ